MKEPIYLPRVVGAVGFGILIIIVCAVCANPENIIGLSPVPQDWEMPPSRDNPDDYVRIRGRRSARDGPWEWVIQTSVRDLHHPRTGVRLKLLAMSHVGRNEYYRSMESILRDTDIVVSEGLNVNSATRKAEVNPELEWIGRLHQVLGKALHLDIQMRWEERIRDHRWINVDLTVDSINNIIEKNPQEWIPREVKEAILLAERSKDAIPNSKGRMECQRRLAAYLLNSVASYMGQSSSDLVQRVRDAAVFRWIRSRLDERRENTVAVVYGAAHIRALESRFVDDLGFRLETTRWHDAMVLTLQPQDTEEWILRGFLRYKENDCLGARDDFTRAIEIDPSIGEAYYFRAICRRKLNELEGTEDDLGRAAALMPNDPRVFMERGSFRCRQGDYEGAIQDLTIVIARRSGDPFAYNYRGIARGSKGDIKGALQDYSESIRLQPNNPDAYHNRGYLKETNGDLDGAIRDYDEAIRLQSDYANTYNNRGRAKKAKGDLDGAIKDFDEAIRLQQDDSEAYNDRGVAKQVKGDLDGAIKDFDEALRLQSDFAKAFNNRGRAKQAKGDLNGAIKDFDEAIRLRPDYSQAYFSRGNVEEIKGDLVNAFADYSEAIRLNPNDQELYFSRGGINNKRGIPDAAIRDYDEAIRLQPNYYDAYLNRAVLKLSQGDLEGAAKDFERAIGLKPQSSVVYLWLGLTQGLRGDKAAGRTAFAKANDADPRNTYAAIWLVGFGGDRGKIEKYAGGTDWSSSLARFFLGNTTREQLLAEARRATKEREIQERLCEAHGYVGLLAERDGDADLALHSYRSCVDTGMVDYIEYVWAKARLVALAKTRNTEK